jgi:hypothetical protein
VLRGVGAAAAAPAPAPATAAAPTATVIGRPAAAAPTSPAAALAVVVPGVVKGATSGTATITIKRRIPARGRKRAHLKTIVATSASVGRTGRFRAQARRLGPGHYVVRATYTGSSTRKASRSGTRRFVVHAPRRGVAHAAGVRVTS